ncbi:MAG: DUF302 domain-containing protein [Alphaproteobacteria bacterium]|nr:DUF302 domain-containing protein [Alphaproteobacteria bacterium]
MMILMFVLGAIFVSVLIILVMPSMMILRKESPYSFDKTIKVLSDNIKKEGWSLMGVRTLHDSIEKHGCLPGRKVALVEMCHPDYANAIISDEKASHISVMMPCTISVFEMGKTVYVSYFNTKPMGWMFGGIVSKIMAGPVAKAQKKFLKF